MTQEEFNAMLAVGIAQGLPGSYYTSRYGSGEEIDRRLGNAAVPASNPNLLDNWYLPYPINQRGTVSGVYWETDVYGIDRWKTFSTNSANLVKWVEGEGIYLIPPQEYSNALIDQRVETTRIPDGSPVTISCLIDGQLASFTTTWDYKIYHSTDVPLSDGMVRFQVWGGSPVAGVVTLRIWTPRPKENKSGYLVKAVKLELGAQQTLAHQDTDGNWVLNDPPPNYALELLKCQRYQQVLNADTYNAHQFGLGIATTAEQVRIIYQLPVRMAKTPTITTKGGFKLNHNMNTPTSNAIEVTSINLVGTDSQTVILRAYGAVTTGDLYALQPTSDIGQIILDANL